MGANKATMMQFWHFGFTASQLNDNFYEMVEDTIQNVLDRFQELLQEECPTNKEKIAQQIKDLYELYMVKIQDPIAKFNEITNEIFNLSDNIVVSCVAGLKPTTPDDLNKLNNDVDQLENRYLQAVIYRSHLQKELETFERFQSLYDKVECILEYHETIKTMSGEKSFKDLYDCCMKLEEALLNKIIDSCDEADVANYQNLFKTE